MAETLLDDVRKQRQNLNLPSLLKREFQAVGKNETGSGKSTGNKSPDLRIMQWNLLAQALSQGDDNFVLCPVSALDWEHRKLHILEELLNYNPTILCLEEVDHFSFIKENLSKAGYDGCFFPKPDSPCLYNDINYGPDGCAVFWKTDGVKLAHKKDIVLQDEKGRETNQVAILCTFYHLSLKRDFFVAVTHLKSKPPYWQLRHEQGKYLEKVLKDTISNSLPLILCGDFNADPQEQVYATFRTSDLSLASAYSHLSPELLEPAYTTWKVRGGPKGNKETAHCIDYVWFSTKFLVPVSVLKLPEEEEIGKDRLPSLTYPSDHLSLVVDLSFKS